MIKNKGIIEKDIIGAIDENNIESAINKFNFHMTKMPQK